MVDLVFSETTDSQFAVCTATKDKIELGLDVALVDRPLPVKSMTKQDYLDRLKGNASLGTPNEWAQIEAFDDLDDQINTFYRLWSIKESVLKATGLGASGIKPSFIDIRLSFC